MNVLAIDCGTRLGWAAMVNDHLESGVHEFNVGRGESPGIRFLRFRNWLADILKMTAPELVVYEQAHLRGGYATDLLVGMTTRIVEECAVRGIEVGTCHSATLKKHALGTGRADKTLMLEEARKRWGRQVADDNQADALWLLDYALKTWGKP